MCGEAEVTVPDDWSPTEPVVCEECEEELEDG
jgi:hypothetical protein